MNKDAFKAQLSRINTVRSADEIYNRIQVYQENAHQILLMLDATGLSADEQNTLRAQIETLSDKLHVSFSQEAVAKSATTRTEKTPPVRTKKRIDNVKKIIMVASGKGGVGKSTTAMKLALALHGQGKSVGLLDADIYGPSLPLMINHYDKPDVTAEKKLIPIHKLNISLMSIGFIVDMNLPMIWRGPMVQGALTQLLFEVDWGYHAPLDVLVIDTPPGTGDVHLTLAQNVAIDGTVVVSTPQDMALIDAQKAIAMCEKLDIPIIGMIENMSFFKCPSCGDCAHIFSHGDAGKMATEKSIQLLGEVPLHIDIRRSMDNGTPNEVDESSAFIQVIYDNIAKQVVDSLNAY